MKIYVISDTQYKINSNPMELDADGGYEIVWANNEEEAKTVSSYRDYSYTVYIKELILPDHAVSIAEVPYVDPYPGCRWRL